MEFAQGQVFNAGRLADHIKQIKEKKELKRTAQEISNNVNFATTERMFLQNRIEYSSDRDLLESDIYRLKAAEILQNYHIKMAKQQFNSQPGGQL